MSNKASETTESQQPKGGVDEGNVAKTPAYVDELLKNGSTILIAATREALEEMVNTIPADVHYGVGAVGHNHETGAFTLRVDINP